LSSYDMPERAHWTDPSGDWVAPPPHARAILAAQAAQAARGYIYDIHRLRPRGRPLAPQLPPTPPGGWRDVVVAPPARAAHAATRARLIDHYRNLLRAGAI
jgi:hypothetical protein